jgi:hypothetical protein
MDPQRINPDEVKRRIDRGERIIFLDTRSDDAWAKADSQIPGSKRVLTEAVLSRRAELPKDGLIVTYCT